MPKLSKRENLLATLRREGWQWLPCDISLTPPKEQEFKALGSHKSVPAYFHLSHRASGCLYKKTYRGDGKELFTQVFDLTGEQQPARFDVDAWGVGMSYGSDAAYHMCHFHSPLAYDAVTVEDIERHPLPKMVPGLKTMLHAHVKQLHARGLAALGSMEQTIWERAWLIRGMDQLMVDMMMNHKRATAILDRITDHSCASAKLLAETGHDIIGLGDDVGMQSTLMMSPDMWQRWLKPRLAKVIQVVRDTNPRALIFYHSCGYIEPLISELIEIGVDILNPVQPESMDFAKIHATYGKDLSFWGGIGTQTTFPFGTPDDVRARIRELVELCGNKGGFVVAPTHVIEPEVPWKNLEAFRDEVEKINSER